MALKLVEINKQLKDVLKEPLELGIGIHFGEVILGEFGYKDKSSLTIIGDTVNTQTGLRLSIKGPEAR
jgi:adenylate cyclase